MSLYDKLFGRKGLFPVYDVNANYNTNAKSYYDSLAKVLHVLEYLAKQIDEYDGTVKEYFERWEQNLIKFPENVENMLTDWLQDGTLDQIINEEIFSHKLDTSIFEQFELSVNQQLAQKSNPLTMIMNDRTEKLLAHRGFSMGAPENTIPAYEWAGKLGYWGSETDIQLTKDGVWILMHDDTLDRMTNGIGSVKDYTLAQIKELIVNDGANVSLYPNLKVPTLKEFLMVCKNYDMVPFIEIKAGTTYASKDYDLLISEIKKYGNEEKTAIISFSKEACTEIRSRNGKIVLFPLLDITQENLNYVKGLKNAGINVYAATVNKAGVELSHSQGVPVACWTANTAVEYATLKEWGVDIVATDVLRHSTKGV